MHKYLDYSGRKDVLSGGVQMIPIRTSHGVFRVWIKRVGNNPTAKVLLLHGGPALTHEYFEAFDSFFPAAGIEYYYYDQLGSAYSDQPDAPDLWTIDRFVDEVEQVRKALGLGSDNFYLLGHSWGAILGIEYALRHQHNLKALVISNMMASIPAYNAYVKTVTMPAIDATVLAQIIEFESAEDFDNPAYVELLVHHILIKHILRMPLDGWPEPVRRAFGKVNRSIEMQLQGRSELGVKGTLAPWDRSNELRSIHVPSLVIGGTHDTMSSTYMEWMAGQLPNGHFLLCPNGSHLAMYDDQETYFEGLISFIKDVDRNQPPGRLDVKVQ